MAAISLLVDLWRKNPTFTTKTFHSNAHLLSSPTFGLSTALATATASSFLSGGGRSVAYADAGADFGGDYLSKLQGVSGTIFMNDYLKYNTKVYPIELKPLLSAFYPTAFATTALRSFLLFYLPLVEEASRREDDDDDFPEEPPEQPDYVIAFKKSVKQIIRETTVVTTRRVLERVASHHVSQRAAWKLVKDVPKSAKRKALRGMLPSEYFFCVCRTTFRGHLLAVAASWLVQVGIDVYRCFSKWTIKAEAVDKAAELKLLGKRVTGITIMCSSALVFASIGAGIGATLVHPSWGTIIGGAAGDIAGPVIAVLVFDKVLHIKLRLSP